jgi:ribose transport system substrate-binding protein
VGDIAQALQVTEGTIRNDLNALSKEGLLERVWGGGVPVDEYPALNEAFAGRMTAQESAKQRIARWAAELVEDGDTIILDASTTVYFMMRFLKDLHGLTVITNGIETGRRLAKNASNTVILLGGQLNANGVPVTTLVSDQFLKDLHIKRAFVSCSGFTLMAGLTEPDIREAQIKSNMIAAAESVVALVDSSKFGRSSVAPFARLDQIYRLFTDSDLDPAWLERLKGTCLAFAVCEETGLTDYSPCVQDARHYRIGFANLSEGVPFAVDVRRGVERAAQEAGNIDLVLADNQLSGQKALNIAERFADQALDLVIEYQIEESYGARIMNALRRSSIPVVAVDIPMIGATFFGADNYNSGLSAGVPLGRWIQANWDGQIDSLYILVEPRAGSIPAARIQGQLDGLRAVIGEIAPEKRVELACGNTTDISEAAVYQALRRLPPASRRIAIVSFNDDAALGALAAARRLGREQDVVIVGQGGDRRVREEMEKPGSPIIGSTAYEPENYGRQLIPLVLKILRGEPVPPAVYVQQYFIPSVDLLPLEDRLKKETMP